MKRFNKFIYYFVSIVSAVSLSIGLASCGGGKDVDVHSSPELAEKKGHIVETIEGQEPTCEEAGWKSYQKCNKCDYTVGYEVIPAKGHSLVFVKGKESSCMYHGYASYNYCNREGCDYTTQDENYFEKVDGHEEYIKSFNGKPATCTEIGWKPYQVCLQCYDRNYEELPALGHLIEDHKAKDATCTEIGWEAYETCGRDGCDHTTYQELPALGHDYQTFKAQLQTCTGIGWEEYQTCQRKGCGDTTYVELPALGHSYEITVVKAPTCFDAGSDFYHCSVCQYEKTVVVEKLGHDDSEGYCKTCYNIKFTEKEDGALEITGLNEENLEKVVIPAEYNGKKITSIAKNAFEGQKKLREISFTNSVTSLGASVFYDCSNLIRVFYTGSVTDWLNLQLADEFSNPLYYGYHFYMNGAELEELEIGDGVTSIRDGAFRNCYGLKSVTIDGSVTNVGAKAFYNCVNLESAVVSGTVGESAFRNCFKMTSVSFADTVTAIGDYAFMGLGLDAFKECENCLKETKEVLNENCNCTYVIPDSVTSIGASAFYNAYGVQRVKLGSGLQTIGASAFENAKNLKTVVAGTSLTTISSNAFASCAALEKVAVSDANAWAGIDFADNLSNPLWYAKKLYDNSNKEIISEYFKISEIKARAFLNCTSLKSITFSADVKTIGALAFTGCSNLSFMEFDLNSTLEKIGESAFAFCGKLKSIVIPATVKVIGAYAFQDCESLTSVAFKQTENWKMCPFAYDNFATGETLKTEIVANATTMANYLTKTYMDKYFAVIGE